jgi:hypothetical protein
MTPPHIVSIYDKPKVGSSQLRRYETFSYRHKISAMGWFDTASFSVRVPKDDAPLFLEQFIGNRIAIHVDNPCEPIWEGLISRMTFNGSGASYTISIDEMGNSVNINYTAAGGSTSMTSSASGTNANSIALYGTKHIQIDAGNITLGTGATTMRDTYLASHAWPLSSFSAMPNGNSLIDVQCIGFSQTLMWEYYRQATSAAVAMSTLVSTVKSGLTNGSTFFDITDASEISTNALTLDQAAIKGESAFDMMNKISEIGNGVTPWIWGITPTRWQTGKRRIYYRAASFNALTQYTSRIGDGLRVRDELGALVNAWNVRPDNIMTVMDYLQGYYTSNGDDPTSFWIANVEYDATRGTVTLYGDDDTGIEGAFNMRRYQKPSNQRKPATPRRLT